MTEAARTPLPSSRSERAGGGGARPEPAGPGPSGAGARPLRRILLRFVLLRLAGMLVVLLLLSLLVFALMHLAPGDLVKTLLGNRQASPDAVAAIRARYHLDDPFLVQYARWLGGALTGDFGTSIRLQIPVAEAIGQRLGVTFWLCAIAFALAAATAIPLGVRAAHHPGGAVDRIVTGLGIVGISAPTFAVGVLLLYAFAYYLPIFPVYGAGTGFWSMLWHLVLPAVSLAVGLGAILLKLTRTAMLTELTGDYVTALRARGIGERRVTRVALRNAAIPIVTAASLVLTFLVGGTLLAETIFALPGLGKLLQDSVLFKDIPVVQAVTLLVAALIAVIALLADLSYYALDARVRQREARA